MFGMFGGGLWTWMVLGLGAWLLFFGGYTSLFGGA